MGPFIFLLLVSLGKLVTAAFTYEYSTTTPPVFTLVTVTVSGSVGATATLTADIANSFVFILGSGGITLDSSGSGKFEVYYKVDQKIASQITLTLGSVEAQAIYVTPSKIIVKLDNFASGFTSTLYAVSGSFTKEDQTPVIVYDNLEISIQLLSNTGEDLDTYLSGTKTRTTLNGLFSFPDMTISNDGTYQFKAVLGSYNGLSNLFDIANKIALVVINSDGTSWYSYYPLVLQIDIIDVNGNLIKSSMTISLSLSDSTLMGGYSEASTSTGTYTYENIYFQTAGTLSLTVTAVNTVVTDSKTKSETYTIFTGTFAVQSYLFATIATQQTIVAEMKNAIGQLIDFAQLSCTLSLILGTTASTNIENGGETLSSAGKCTYTNVRITHAGTYSLNIVAIGISTYGSSQFDVTSSIVSVTLAPTVDFRTTYFLYDFEATLYGEGNYLFLDGASGELSADGDSALGGTTTSSSPVNGKITFSGIYFTTKGTKLLTATITHSIFLVETLGTLTAEVVNADITVDTFAPLLTTEVKSDISIKITNTAGTLRTASTEFNCNIIITNSELSEVSGTCLEVDSVSGNTASQTSVLGVCTFKNVRVIKAGDYRFTFYSLTSGITTKSIELFTTVNSAIIITVSPVIESTTFTAYFLYDFNVLLKDENDGIILESYSVTLSASDSTALGGPLTKSSTSGLASFTGIYFQTSGAISLVATITSTSTYTGSLSLTISNALIKIQPFTALATIGVSIILTAKFVNLENAVMTSDKALTCDINLYKSDGLTLINENLEYMLGSVQSSSGVCTFLGPRIKRSGSYIITVSSTNVGTSSDSTASFVTTSSISVIYLTSMQLVSSFVTYFSYSFSVKLYGDGGFDYLESSDIELKLSGSNTIYNYAPKTSVVSGLVEFTNIYFDTSGELTLTASALTLSGTTHDSSAMTLPITKIKIYSNGVIVLPTIESKQNIQISFGDDEQNIPTSDKVFSCNFELYNSLDILSPSNIEGTTTATSSGEFCIFPDIRIKRSGDYYIKFSISNASIDSLLSNTFTTTSSLQSITSELSSGPYSIYFTYELTGNIYGEGSFPYLEGVTLILNMDDGSEIGNYGSKMTSDGTYQFNIYFTSTGARILTIVATQDNDSINTKTDTINISLVTLTVNVGFTAISTIGDLTQVTATIKDANLITEANNGAYHCVLKLQDYATGADNGSISGTLTADDVAGVCTFNNIRITRSGSYKFYVSISMTSVVLDGHSSEVIITSSIQTITASVVNSSPSIYFDFVVSVTIKGEGNYDYLESCTITITASDGSTIGSSQSTTSTGSASMTIYVTSTTLTSIKATASGVNSNNVPLTPTPLKFTLDITVGYVYTVPYNSDNSFELTINVKSSDNRVETKNYNSGKYPFTITLTAYSESYSGTTLTHSGTSYPDGVYSSETAAGTNFLSELKVLSSGGFLITVSSTLTPTIETDYVEFTIYNGIKTITISADSEKTIYFPFDFVVTILGDDDNNFLGLCTLVLNIDGGSYVETPPTSTSTGLVTSSIFFTTLEGKTLSVSCSEDASVDDKASITIVKEILDVALSDIPTSGLDSFSVTVAILDSTNTLSQTAGNDPNDYEIALRLYSNDDDVYQDDFFIGENLILTTSDGTITFDNLKIIKTGNYFIEATADSDNIQVGKSEDFYVLVGITDITIDYPDVVYSFFSFSITVNLFVIDEIYNSCTEVTIEIETDILAGDLTKSNPGTGTLTFSDIYFVEYGDITIKISGFTGELKDSKEFVITVIPSIIILTVDEDSNRRLTSSANTFSITAAVYNFEGGDLSSYTHTISLSIQPVSDIYSGNALSEYTSKETESGICQFTGIRILSMGSFQFKATSSMLTSSLSTDILTIENAIIYLLVENNDGLSYVNRNDPFEVKVQIVGEDDNYYIGAVDVEFDQTPNLSFSGLDSKTNENGILIIEAIPLRSGPLRITASVTDLLGNVFSTPLDLVSHTAAIEVVFDPIPTESSTVFSISIYAYGSSGVLANYVVEASLTFNCKEDSTCSGLVTEGIKNSNDDTINTDATGHLLLENCHIYSSGDFVLLISSAGFVESKTYLDSFINFVKTIQIGSLSSVPSVNFLVSLTITLTGDDELAYILPTTVSLSDQNNYPITGEVSLDTSTGQSIHNIRFSNAKIYNVFASTTSNLITESLSVTVNKGMIKLSIPGDPYYDNKEFLVSAEVYDHSGTTLESEFGEYAFTLITEPSIELTTNLLETTAGKGTLSTLIGTIGSYTINIKDSNFLDVTTNSIIVKEGIESMTTTAKLQQNKNTLFELPIKMTNKYGAGFNHETTLTITCDTLDIHGESLSIITSNSTASFWIYFTASGTKKCTVQSSFTVSVSFTFTISSTEVNTDPICNIGITENWCYKCKDAAKKDSNGICTCESNSYYDVITEFCVCEDDFELIDGFCVQCGWFFKPEEIEGYYEEGYKGIIMSFSKQVARSNEGSCDSIVTVPDSLMENYLGCSWVNTMMLKIAFSKIINGVEFYMELDPSLIQYVKSGSCSKDVYELKIKIAAIYDKPTPSASITAPSSLSVGCGDDTDIIILTKNVDTDYKYIWSSTINPENKDLSNLISEQTAPSFSVNLKSFSVGEVVIYLDIVSITFATKGSSQTIINISNELEIMAQMSVGNSVSIKKSDTLIIKPSIINTCGTTGPYVYTWSCLKSDTSDNFNFENFLAKQKTQDKIIIYPDDLNVEVAYTFTVTIDSGDIKGSTSTTVIVEPNPIEIIFLRSSGSVGNLNDLTIGIQAWDPDDNNAEPIIAWSCLEGLIACTDDNGEDLLGEIDITSYEITIPKESLKNGTYYSFVAKASANNKNTIKQIDIEINAKIKGSVKIKAFQKKMNTQLAAIVTPEIEAYQDPLFNWTFSPALENANIENIQPFIYIPPNSLKYGVNYQLNFKMYEKNQEDSATTGFISITTYIPPECTSFNITETTAGKFLLTGIECKGDDSPVLIYQYGFVNKKGVIIPLTLPLYTTPIEIKVPSYAKTLALTVCDMTGAYRYFIADMPESQNSRQLDESDLLVSFDVDTVDSDYIPSSVIYYAGVVTEEITYNYIFDVNFDYFNEKELDSLTFFTFLSTMQALLESSYFTNTTISDDIIANVTLSILDAITEYTLPITQQQGDFIFEILAPYTSRIDFEVLQAIYEIVAESEMTDVLLDGHVSYNDGVNTIYRYRNSGDYFKNTEITAGNNSINFFNISGFKDTDVLDIYFTKFTQDYDFFEITFFLTGSYESYTLVLDNESNTVNITVEENITTKIEGNFNNDSNYICEYLNGNSWSSNGCNIESVNDEYVILTLDHLSTFRIQVDNNKSCDVGAGPIAAMSVIIFIMIFLSVIFVLSDKNIEHPSISNKFLLLYPLTSVFIQQPKSRRTIIVIQILTSELLMLTLIGAFHNHFDSPEDQTDNSFDNYYGFQLSRGAAAWALTQVFTLPIFTLNAFMLKGKNFYMITIPVCIFITIGCFCGLIVMTVYYCLGWTEYWIINWLIFLLFDIATLEIIYALALSYLIKVDTYEPTSKNSPSNKSKNNLDEDISTRRQPGENEANEESDEYEIIAHQP